MFEEVQRQESQKVVLRSLDRVGWSGERSGGGQGNFKVVVGKRGVGVSSEIIIVQCLHNNKIIVIFSIFYLKRQPVYSKTAAIQIFQSAVLFRNG